MPTYEYECQDCHHRFERRQAMTDPPVALCPDCGGAGRRLLSGGAGIIVRDGAASGAGRGGAGCNLERVGATCCGRSERCDKPPCGSH